ncbi:hypothetical protein, partial [Segatella sp.]
GKARACESLGFVVNKNNFFSSVSGKRRKTKRVHHRLMTHPHSFRLDSTRETRERIVARIKIVNCKSLALERASGFAFSYHKTKKTQQPPCGHGGH